MRTLVAAVAAIALALVAAPAALADSAGLVGAYGFEEAAGTAAVDSSSAGNAGVFNGATRSASGRFGAAASFDGVNDRIDIADSNSLDLTVGMTLEAWVRPTALGWRTAILKERPGGLAYGLYASTDNNRPSAEIHAETRAPSAIAMNVWTHVATTYDGATLRLYVNGAQVSSRAVTGPITISSGALRIGGNAVWGGEYFKGLIDEVRVYNRALTAGEIQLDQNTAVVSPDQPPSAPALTANVTGGDDVHLSWTGATDDVGVASYRLYRNGLLLTTLGASAYDIVDEAVGTVAYKVVAVDTAGQASPDSNTATVTIDPDAQAPTAPVVTGTVTEKYDIHLTWTPATDDLGVKEYRVFTGSQLRATVGPGTTEWTFVKPSWGGNWSFTVVAVDNAGHTTSSAPVVVRLDPSTTPPVPVFDTPCDGVKPHDFAPIQFYAPAVLLGSRTAWAEVDGRTVWGPVTNPASTTSFTWRTWLESDGPHVMTVHVRQADGTEFVSKPCEMTVDNLAVTATIAAPAAGATVSGVIALDADVFTDGVRDRADWSGWYPAYDPVDLYFIPDNSVNSYRAASDAPYTATLDTRGMTNGPHTLRADVIWGHNGYPARTTSPTITFYVDNSPSRPTGVAAAATADDVLVSWNAATGDPAVTGYRVFRDGTQIATVTDTSYTDADRPNGTYAYTVVAVNSRGASQPSDAASATVDIDRTPPAVTLDAGCDGATLSEYVGPINGTATDNGGGNVTVRVAVDGTTIWGPNPVNGAFHFDWDTRTVANGAHTMSVIARDELGNETVKDCPWTVSNRALSIPITGASDGGTVSGTVALGFQPQADGAAATAGAVLQIDGAAVAATGSAPYAYTWDTTQVANGVHTIKATMHWLDYPNPLATTTIQVTVNNAPPPASGLVAAYGFEQTSGTSVTDSSGKGSTGTLSGASWAADGKFGRALSFDGVNDIVTVPDSSLLDLAPGMTLEAWVKPTTAGGWRTVLLKERPGQLTYGLYATGDNGRPLAEVAAGTQRDARGTAALTVGVWTHLAATYDKSTLRLYVNGVQVSSTAVTGTLLNSTGALKIGGNAIWGEYFSGLIDEVRVYERALSAAEIAADKDRAV